MLKKISFFFTILILIKFTFAGVTGKIAGVITDKDTGEPLPGVNVILKGTRMGASTDADGYFVILNIPPGTYDLEAIYVGYTNYLVKGLQVSVDLTTEVNIQMSSTTLETSETITVVAQRPIIQTDEVSTRHFVSSEEIALQPVNSFQEIARNQAGVVGNHFRGGRSNEVLVLVDGIPVKSPAGTYSGDLGGFTTDVPEFGIQELEVSLGGFSAEYGNVQSGILNVALMEGRDKFSGRFRFTSSPGTSAKSFTENGITFNRLQPLENIYELNFSGPIIPNKLSFSLSAEITDKKRGFYINQQAFNQTYQGKLTYNITPNLKLAAGGIFNRRKWDSFYFPASRYGPGEGYTTDHLSLGVKNDTLTMYRYVDDESLYGKIIVEDTPGMVDAVGDTFNVTRTYYMAGMQEYLWNSKQSSDMAYLLWTHALNENTYYEIRYNYFFSNYHYATRDVDDRDGDGDRDEDLQWDISKPGPHPIYREREENYWWIRGDDPGYRDQSSVTNTLKLDLVSQMNANNLIKAGIETNYHLMDVENISWTLGVGTYRKDIWKQNLFDFAMYAQDKMEFAGIVAIIGLRFDLFDPNGLGAPVLYPADYEYPFSFVDENGIPILNNPKEAKMKTQLSPRLGFSFPITETSIMHFTYGHYFQRPDGYYLYRNYKLQSLTKVGNFVGYPNLNPEKTVAYEVGVEQQLLEDYKFTVTGYYKDVTNLMNWHKYVGRSINNSELNVYTNADYGNIKGLEFTFSKLVGRFWGGSINYTYSLARGRSSNATGGSGSFTDVKRMNILNFDQTHTVNANLTFKTPEEYGWILGDWVANVQFKYGSGLPYSSYGTNKINDKRMPWTSTTDIKLLKNFRLGKVGLNVFMDVFNIFDKMNVLWIGNTQYYDSGDPADASIKGDPSVVRRMADGTYIRNSQVYSGGRLFRFGLGLYL